MIVDERGRQHRTAEGVLFEVSGEPGGFHIKHTVASDDGPEGACRLSDGGLDGKVGS